MSGSPARRGGRQRQNRRIRQDTPPAARLLADRSAKATVADGDRGMLASPRTSSLRGGGFKGNADRLIPAFKPRALSSGA